MDDGIHNTRLVHQYHHGLSHTYGKGGGKYPDGSLAEKLAGVAGLHAENQGEHTAHDDINSGDLREGPVEADTAVALNDDHSQEYQDPQRSWEGHFLCHGGLGILALIHILFTEKAVSGIFFYFAAVNINSGKSYDIKDRQTQGAEADPRKQGESHDLLGHACGKSIHQPGGKSHRAADHRLGGAYHPVISQGKSYGHSQRIERIGRFTVSQNAEDHEDGIKDTDNGKFPSLCLFQDQADRRAECAADLQKIDHSGADKQRSHDRRPVDEAVINGLKVIHKTDGIFVFYVLKAVGIDDAQPRGAVGDSFIGSAGDQVGKNDDQQHDQQKYDKNMRHLE